MPSRTNVASACWTMLVNASCAIRRISCACAGPAASARPATTSRDVEAACTPRPLDLVGQHILQVAVVDAPGPATPSIVRRVCESAFARLAVRGGDQRCRRRRRCRRRGRLRRGRADRSRRPGPDSAMSYTSRSSRSRSAAVAWARARSSAMSCIRAFARATAACLANSCSSSASAGAKVRASSRLNTTQTPMIDPRHSSGTPMTPRSVARSAASTWPPRTSSYRSNHTGPRRATTAPVIPSRQREDLPRLAPDADVGLLAIGAGGLVDAADRPGVACPATPCSATGFARAAAAARTRLRGPARRR